MVKMVTYHGPEDREFVTDSEGAKHFFPRDKQVQVRDEVAELAQAKTDQVTVEDDRDPAR